MKRLAASVIFFALPVLGHAADLESRIAELEARTTALEKALAQKLERCTLSYKHYTNSLNSCPEGTFVHGIVPINSTTNQLDCGYYQLQCFRAPAEPSTTSAE